MSATRKPAPSEVGAPLCSFNGHAPAVARFILSDGCLGRNNDREQLLCMQHVITAQPIGTMQMVEILDENWREDLLSRWKLQSGAPRQPTASPAKLDGVSINMTLTEAELNDLLDAMARRVVEEAARLMESEMLWGGHAAGIHIRGQFTKSKLAQLREAVQKP